MWPCAVWPTYIIAKLTAKVDMLLNNKSEMMWKERLLESFRCCGVFLGGVREGVERRRLGWQRFELVTCSVRSVGRAAGGHSTGTFVEKVRVMKISSQVAPELVTGRAAAVTAALQLDCRLTRTNDGDFGTQQHTESKTIPWFIVNVRLFSGFFLRRVAVGLMWTLISRQPTHHGPQDEGIL